jgi:hypothetical protein
MDNLIDLSDLLAEAPKGRLPKVAKKLPPKPKFEPGFVICKECKGSGKRVHKETHTPELTEKAEDLLESFGKVLPVQNTIETIVKCEKCSGNGSHFLPSDVRATGVTLFWTRSQCRCGARYEGPAHTNSCCIRNEVYMPIIVDGVHKFWKYKETTYVPSQEILPIHKTLPMSIEFFDYSLEACRKCIHEQVIICLGHEPEVLAS